MALRLRLAPEFTKLASPPLLAKFRLSEGGTNRSLRVEEGLGVLPRLIDPEGRLAVRLNVEGPLVRGELGEEVGKDVRAERLPREPGRAVSARDDTTVCS